MIKILIVDDDPAMRRVLRALFERDGCTVTTATSADEALLAIAPDSPERPDAVVCDVLMPGMTGLEFYARLAEVAPDLRESVVFLTGSNADPAVHVPIEQLGVPMLGKLGDLQLVVDAIHLALLRQRLRP